MSDTGDNVTDEAKREEAREEEEERQKQKEKEEQREREEKERKQKEEKERKQKEEKERKDKEEKDRKDKEEKDRKDKEEKDRKDKEEKDREQKQNEQKDTEREYDTEKRAEPVVNIGKNETDVEQSPNMNSSAKENSAENRPVDDLDIQSLNDDDRDNTVDNKISESNPQPTSSNDVTELQQNDKTSLQGQKSYGDNENEVQTDKTIPDADKPIDKQPHNSETEAKSSNDDYVPLDKKWSSPKREYQGIKREYSFNSPSRTFSSSSDKMTSENLSEVKREIKKDETITQQTEDSAVRDNNISDDTTKIDEVDELEKNKPVENKTNVQTRDPDVEDKPQNETILENENESSNVTENTDRVHTEKSDEIEKKPETTKAKPDVDDETNEQEESVFVTSTKYTSTQNKEPQSPRSEPESPRSPRSPPPSQMTWMNSVVNNTADKDTDRAKNDSDNEDHDGKAEETEPEQEVPKVEIKTNSKTTENKRSNEKSSTDTERKKSFERMQLSKPEEKSRKTPSPASPRRIMASERKTQKPTAKSAGTNRRQGSSKEYQSFSAAQARSPRASSVQNTPRSRPRPKTTTGVRSIVSEEGKAKQREFFKAELMRLEKSLKDESSKIVRPKVKNYSPFVFTTLEPYYNTYVPNFLIDLCDERGFQKNAEDPRPGYVSRNTAIGLCDPWMDLRMDRELLPRLSTPASKSRKKTAGGKKRKDKKERPPKEGSTRLPKFPVVDFNTNKENATKQFLYSEVPRFRQEMAGRYSQTAPKKIEVDYTRTRQDFYRMNLDRLDEIHPVNRPHMRQAYFAYLQNTPGSKKAVKECVKGLEKDPQAQQAH